MGYCCAASMCWSASQKKKNLHKYPWMADVSFVKFPKDPAARAAWKKLLRRKDNFEPTCRSRLCSRHFDEWQIGRTGYADGVPKYFFWNNYGYGQRQSRVEDSAGAAAITERNRAVTHVPFRPELRPAGSQLAASAQPVARRRPNITYLYSKPTIPRLCLISLRPTKMTIAGEITIEQCPNQDKTNVGHMNLLQDPQEVHIMVPQPQDHDYITHRQPSTETSVQTDLTARDIELLEEHLKARKMEHLASSEDLVADGSPVKQ